MTKETTGTNRRGFLKLAGTAAPAAIAAVALSSPDKAQAKPVDLSATTMQDTDHTRAYLASARF
ncbi:twin-arginine translocation signal domain-containing protein [Loktanella sp. SALINAS62]|uniref:twin-arginine translocation signal domain-containing protein n=1 Tax=Loktanella sp. SALINAS62 TaxID=2706124 RepID=UPI001B8B200C|nr:twin-arginine translocation signal domain-containing protein [Loktanella sp. SALINAS62]MBS1303729.1 twin-arginine translocation signal domain-containing protein [Loktanella sp. SALINAS62]